MKNYLSKDDYEVMYPNGMLVFKRGSGKAKTISGELRRTEIGSVYRGKTMLYNAIENSYLDILHGSSQKHPFSVYRYFGYKAGVVPKHVLANEVLTQVEKLFPAGTLIDNTAFPWAKGLIGKVVPKHRSTGDWALYEEYIGWRPYDFNITLLLNGQPVTPIYFNGQLAVPVDETPVAGNETPEPFTFKLPRAVEAEEIERNEILRKAHTPNGIYTATKDQPKASYLDLHKRIMDEQFEQAAINAIMSGYPTGRQVADKENEMYMRGDGAKNLSIGNSIEMGSGDYRQFESGSRRDNADDKPNVYDIHPYAMLRHGYWMKLGELGYGKGNWELGQPKVSVLDSLNRHVNFYNLSIKDPAMFELLDDGSDHLSAIIFNASMLLMQEGREGVHPMVYFDKLKDFYKEKRDKREALEKTQVDAGVNHLLSR